MNCKAVTIIPSSELSSQLRVADYSECPSFWRNSFMIAKASINGERHGRIWKDPVPFTEGLVRGDHDGTSLIACGDEFEEHAGFGLVLGDVGQIVEDKQIELVERVDGGFELEFAAGDLQLLDEIGCSGEQHPPAVLDQCEADGCGEMALAAAGRPEQQDISPLGDQPSPAAIAMTWS